MRRLTLWLLLCGCNGKTGADTATAGDMVSVVDADGDGFSEDEDCDDSDAAINPDTVEVCDGADNDCDGSIDEGVRLTFYRDADGDGFGDPERESESCAPTDGTVEDDTDCDDDDATVYPGAEEVLGDGIDNDCDGSAKLTGG